MAAQVYDRAGNQAQSSPWSFTVSSGTVPSLDVTKYYYHGDLRIAMRQEDVVYPGLPGGSQDRLHPRRSSFDFAQDMPGFDLFNN